MGIIGYSKGWGDPNEYDEYDNSSGGNDGGGGISTNERLYRFRFSIPTPMGTDKKPNLVPGAPATKRVLFLDGSPFKVYEHGLWRYKNAYDVFQAFTAICLEKNGLSRKPCLLCSGKKDYASLIGFFPIIDMGQVEYRNGKVFLHHEYWVNSEGEHIERSFQRVLLGARRGSVDNPGILKTLQLELEKIRQQHGIEDLTGTIWDTTRKGKKDDSVGSEWRFIDRLLPEDFERYLVSWGADPGDLNLDIPVYTSPDSGNGVFDVDVESYHEKFGLLVRGNNKQQNSRNNSNMAQNNQNRQQGFNQGQYGMSHGRTQREPAQASGAGFGGGYSSNVNNNGFNSGGQYVGPNGPNDDDIPF